MAERFYGGLGWPMVIEAEDPDEIIEKLEAKRNRTERKQQLVSVQSLNRTLRRSLGTVAGARIEAELDGRFRKLYKLRAKG